MGKIRAYRQLEHSDCGITCIRIIAAYWGRVMPLKRLRELCDMSRSGVSIQELASGLQKLNIHSRAVKLPMEEAVRHADVIHYIDNGQITESGSHDSLMALDGAYARLINGQLSETVANTTYAE